MEYSTLLHHNIRPTRSVHRFRIIKPNIAQQLLTALIINQTIRQSTEMTIIHVDNSDFHQHQGLLVFPRYPTRTITCATKLTGIESDELIVPLARLESKLFGIFYYFIFYLGYNFFEGLISFNHEFFTTHNMTWFSCKNDKQPHLCTLLWCTYA